MPLYEYRDKRTGQVVELLRAVSDRDQVPAHLERLTVPARVGAIRGLISDEGAGYKVPRALAEVESAQGSRCGAREIARHFGMPIDRIKRVWGMACLVFALVFLSAQVSAQINGELTRGITLQDGQRVSAAQLHSLVDNASINGVFYTGQPVETQLLASDYLLVWSTVANGFFKATANTAFLANTNIIAGQVQVTGGAASTNWWLLSYDANNGVLDQINFTNLLNFVLGITNLWAPTTNSEMLVYDKGIWKAATNGSWLNPTNFQLLSTPTNEFALTVFDEQTNSQGMQPYRSSLVGLITNAPYQGNSNYTYTLGASVVPASGTNFVFSKTASQSFVSTNLPIFTTLTNVAVIPHGLPGTPARMSWVLLCITNDLSFTVGAEVDAGRFVRSGTSLPEWFYYADATNLVMYRAASSAGPTIQTNRIPVGSGPQPTAGFATINTNNWVGKVYATWLGQ